MSPQTLFETADPEPPGDVESAIEEIGNVMDKWQRLLSPDEWAAVRKAVEGTFRVTCLEPTRKT